MKKIVFVLVTTMLMSSCYTDAQETSHEGNGIRVEFLFEKDGVRMYRFRDGGHTHYYTNKGETITTQKSDKYQYQENIN
jgi:hypothetical protein